MNSNFLISQLNKLEKWLEKTKSIYYLYPLRFMGYMVLFFALMISNFLAIIRWPIASLKRKFYNEKNHSSASIHTDKVNDVNAIVLKEVLSEETPVLVDFWAEWCGPCIMMNNSLKKLAESDSAGCIIVKIDTVKHKELAEKYNVKVLPTLLLYKNDKELKRYAGALSYQELKEFISI